MRVRRRRAVCSFSLNRGHRRGGTGIEAALAANSSTWSPEAADFVVQPLRLLNGRDVRNVVVDRHIRVVSGIGRVRTFGRSSTTFTFQANILVVAYGVLGEASNDHVRL